LQLSAVWGAEKRAGVRVGVRKPIVIPASFFLALALTLTPLRGWLQLFYYPPKLSLTTEALVKVVAKEDLLLNEFFRKDATRNFLIVPPQIISIIFSGLKTFDPSLHLSYQITVRFFKI
jgi:hypothetical protein